MPSIKPYVGESGHISLDDVCFLLTSTIVKDKLRQEIEVTTSELVYCFLQSVGQKEYAATMQAGLKSEMMLLIDHDEYDGQKSVEYNRVPYTIYRTFARRDGYLELYCEVRVDGH